MNRRSVYKLTVDIPMLNKETLFVFYDGSGHVYWIDDGRETDIPLRDGLAGYLWLLRTENKYMKLIESDYE